MKFYRMEGLKMTELTVNLDKTINASIVKVFDAWLKPNMLSQLSQPVI